MKLVLNQFSIVLLFTSGVLAASFPVTAETSLSLSLWDDVSMGPPDAILGIAQAFRACTDDTKGNVCAGAYCDGTGSPWALASVRADRGKSLQYAN